MARVAIVLPPREAFSPEAAGAIAHVVHTHARLGELAAVVLGRPMSLPGARPFAGVAFRPVSPALRPASEALRYAAGAAAVLREIRPDLIEVHNRPDVALFLARRFPAVSLILHNDPRGMREARTTRQRDRLRHRLAHIFGVSPWVEAQFGPGPGASVLPNGLDLSALPPVPSVREKLILFAGRIVADKGADLFVDACAKALPLLPGWTARMIGADRFGPNSPDTAFLRALRPRAAAAGVTMDGYRPRDEVLLAMASSAIVAMPGRWPEPFGLVALEAMASGSTLVFTPLGGLPDLVADAGLAVPPDADRIAAALVALARDPDRRARLAAAGLARAHGFSAATAAARLDAQRAAILATWSPPPPPPI